VRPLYETHRLLEGAFNEFHVLTVFYLDSRNSHNVTMSPAVVEVEELLARTLKEVCNPIVI